VNPVPAHPISFGFTAPSIGVQSAGGRNNILDLNSYGDPEFKGSLGTYTLDEMRDKAARDEWNEAASDGKSSIIEVKEGLLDDKARVFRWLQGHY
jgi:hypothetical protein